MLVSWPTFEHDCPACVFLGSEDRVAPRWRGWGFSTARWRDFYLCRAHGVPAYTARFGNSPGDYVAVSSESLERWDFREWAAMAREETEDHAVPLNALYRLHRDGALERGFTVYPHFDAPNRPYIMVSPALAPQEHDVLHTVVLHVTNGYSRFGSGAPLDDDATDKLAGRVLVVVREVANKLGAVTRWNRWGRDVVNAETRCSAHADGVDHGGCPGPGGLDHDSGRFS